MNDNYGPLNGKVVAVTGASGYIGSTLVNRLSKSSCNIIKISRKEFVDFGGGRSILADIQNPEVWFDIVS
jgi:FlaA1/EpsC-like NDP-sugar epimerase